MKNIDKNFSSNNFLKSSVYLIFNIILFIVSSFTNLKKFELISNDFYGDELLFYLKEILKISIPKEYTKFHFLNLNVEINSLDNIAFKKILNIVSKNNSLTNYDFLKLKQ